MKRSNPTAQMHEALEKWTNQLSQAALPVCPGNAERVRQLSTNERSTIRELAAVFEGDPGLAAALLRQINALRHRHLQAQVTTVEHGLLMLGMEHTSRLPQSVSSIETIRNRKVRARIQSLFGQAQHAAWQARDWALLRRDGEPNEHYAAALLHNMAEVLLWQQEPELMDRLEETLANGEMEPEEAQYVVLGCGLDELTRALAQRWALPELLRESLRPENARSPRPRGVILATQLARTAQKDWYSAATSSVIEQVAEHLGFEFGGTAARLHRTAAVAAREGSRQRSPAAARLLFPARPEAEPGWHRRTTDQRPQPAPFCLVPQAITVRRTLQRLQAPETGHLRFSEIIGIAMEGMHDGIGLNRVVFAMLNREGDQLQARHITGTDNDPAFNNHFVIELNGSDLFSRMLKRPQGLWLNADNRAELKALIPSYFQNLIGTPHFLAMSVFAGQRPLGIFYADRHTGACELDGAAYQAFKQLGQQVAKTLAERLS